MRGYVQNQGNQAYFICQRQIPPRGKVEFDDIYKSVSKKSGLEKTNPEGIVLPLAVAQVPKFVEFLKTQIFIRGTWGYYGEDGTALGEPGKKAPAKEKTAPKPEASNRRRSSKKSKDAKGAGRVLSRDADEALGVTVTPAAIIEAPYEQARGLIEKTKDRLILKKALNLTKHFAGKEQHMRHILKRLEQVY